jgi:Bacteriocin-protection, YdeI or OmpD-Associated/Domain of unknown function (DUF1905)
LSHEPQTEGAHIFSAQIYKVWIMRVVDVPRDVSKSLRKIAGENPKHIPVQGQVEGLPLKSTLSPRGGGSYRLHIHSNIWRKLHIDAGDSVEVMLQLDREPRDPALPHDLAGGLAEEPRALATFNSLTPALRRQIVRYVDMAKHANTREKRIRLMVKRMLERAAKRKKKKNKRRS